MLVFEEQRHSVWVGTDIPGRRNDGSGNKGWVTS